MQLFFSNPNRSFYVREITRKIDEQINSVRRELANLLSIGIISSDNNNNRLYYEVNQDYEYYKALSAIFGKGSSKTVVTTKDNKTVEENEDILNLKKIGNVDLALLTGQFTRDESAGIDMLVVGDVNQTKLNKYVSELEAKEGKEIRFVSMDTQEYDYRSQVKDRFLNTLQGAKKQILIDKNNRMKT